MRLTKASRDLYGDVSLVVFIYFPSVLLIFFLKQHQQRQSINRTCSTLSKRALDSGMPAMSSRLSAPPSPSSAEEAFCPLPPFLPASVRLGQASYVQCVRQTVCG